VIGRVAFAHDFEQGQGPEGVLIMDAWRKQANLGMEFGGFIALLVLRQFPFIGKLPLPAIEAQSAIKNTIKPLARCLIERGVDDLEGRDLLSILCKSWRVRLPHILIAIQCVQMRVRRRVSVSVTRISSTISLPLCRSTLPFPAHVLTLSQELRAMKPPLLYSI